MQVIAGTDGRVEVFDIIAGKIVRVHAVDAREMVRIGTARAVRASDTRPAVIDDRTGGIIEDAETGDAGDGEPDDVGAKFVEYLESQPAPKVVGIAAQRGIDVAKKPKATLIREIVKGGISEAEMRSIMAGDEAAE